MEILTPRPLKRGDRVAILSPSGIIKPQTVYNAMPVLADRGWVTYVGKHTFDRYSTYAGTDDARYEDLEAALLDPDTRAIICSRGGYGAVHLLDRLDRLPLRDDPKWIVGYSDISALHALMSKHGIQSIHAPMCKHIAQHKGMDEDSQRLFRLLEGERPEIRVAGNRLNRPGEATGILYGGNLAVTAGLISTPFDVLRGDTILFIEDIAEPVYKVERILYNLRLNGTLASLRGLIVGRFTDYTPGVDKETMEQMIARMVEPYDYPVAFGVPIGHVDHNIPMVCSSTVTLTVTPNQVTIKDV
ncbi:MAG: LD-carboxypeptidase [Duncaniella sp.]|nr:LD-carboxypeptidase [Duncaniella sp.]